ncbi:MAG: pantetheine-phosphate adenylyltransferase [Schleiferiaceae bacterium]|tara:strand:+ start:21581 stop:22042 length:462 start_codon:yes stop_codon:yes gene_type:complete
MERVAIFPGSFDPITIGHVDIIQRALPLFDKIIISVGSNSEKKYFFNLEKRIQWIKKVFIKNPKIEVKSYNKLTVEFAKDSNARFLIRGLRNISDFEFEKTMAHANSELNPSIESVFLLTKPKYSFITSTVVRDTIRNDGDYWKFVPNQVVIE